MVTHPSSLPVISRFFNLPILDTLTTLVNFARPNYAAVGAAGFINSQGDKSMKSDSTRALFGLDGSGNQSGCNVRQLQDNLRKSTADRHWQQRPSGPGQSCEPT